MFDTILCLLHSSCVSASCSIKRALFCCCCCWTHLLKVVCWGFKSHHHAHGQTFYCLQHRSCYKRCQIPCSSILTFGWGAVKTSDTLIFFHIFLQPFCAVNFDAIVLGQQASLIFNIAQWHSSFKSFLIVRSMTLMFALLMTNQTCTHC